MSQMWDDVSQQQKSTECIFRPAKNDKRLVVCTGKTGGGSGGNSGGSGGTFQYTFEMLCISYIFRRAFYLCKE